MHEILFRGKRLDNGKWAYGYLIRDEFPEMDPAVYIGYLFGGDAHDTDVVKVDPKTVEQYTELVDRNGNKIFK